VECGSLPIYLTCHESSESFTRSIAGRPQSHREWFEAERELFNFFFNGLSAIESFYYATYCLAAMLDAAQFSVDREEDRKRVALNQSGVSKLSRAFPGNEVSAALEVMIGSTDYTEWGTIRNVLTHRTHPPRHYFITIGMEPTEVRIESRLSEIGTLDTSTTERRRNWLAAQLGELIVSAGKFAAKSFL
jgi:hypothetical protein